tara:strand:- start:530 stop:631 length:102 start_codon:yes stop_codon:yes gene_type:complete
MTASMRNWLLLVARNEVSAQIAMQDGWWNKYNA